MDPRWDVPAQPGRPRFAVLDVRGRTGTIGGRTYRAVSYPSLDAKLAVTSDLDQRGPARRTASPRRWWRPGTGRRHRCSCDRPARGMRASMSVTTWSRGRRGRSRARNAPASRRSADRCSASGPEDPGSSAAELGVETGGADDIDGVAGAHGLRVSPGPSGSLPRHGTGQSACSFSPSRPMARRGGSASPGRCRLRRAILGIPAPGAQCLWIMAPDLGRMMVVADLMQGD